MMPLFLVSGVFFLKMCGVEEDNFGYLGGGLGTDYLSPEPFINQPWQQAGMVEVGVGQQHGVQSVRLDAEGLPVTGKESSFLVETAVHEKAGTVGL